MQHNSDTQPETCTIIKVDAISPWIACYCYQTFLGDDPSINQMARTLNITRSAFYRKIGDFKNLQAYIDLYETESFYFFKKYFKDIDIKTFEEFVGYLSHLFSDFKNQIYFFLSYRRILNEYKNNESNDYETLINEINQMKFENKNDDIKDDPSFGENALKLFQNIVTKNIESVMKHKDCKNPHPSFLLQIFKDFYSPINK